MHTVLRYLCHPPIQIYLIERGHCLHRHNQSLFQQTGVTTLILILPILAGKSPSTSTATLRPPRATSTLLAALDLAVFLFLNLYALNNYDPPWRPSQLQVIASAWKSVGNFRGSTCLETRSVRLGGSVSWFQRVAIYLIARSKLRWRI